MQQLMTFTLFCGPDVTSAICHTLERFSSIYFRVFHLVYVVCAITASQLMIVATQCDVTIAFCSFERSSSFIEEVTLKNED